MDEIKFGDNDNLSALITNLIEADLLIILTDIEGFAMQTPDIIHMPDVSLWWRISMWIWEG